MRINVFVVSATGLSRRAADAAIKASRVTINERTAVVGELVEVSDIVKLDGQILTPSGQTQTLMLNKPVGYVCSRNGQGNKTIYDLLPQELHGLKTVGRLDKDSSGLILLTNDGQLANQLTHPSFSKQKIYQVTLNKELTAEHRQEIQQGVQLEDGPSKLQLEGSAKDWTVTMSEGRNRQIRRTFGTRGYKVVKLHRTQFGNSKLNDLPAGQYRQVNL